MDRLKHNALCTLWVTCWTMPFVMGVFALLKSNPLPSWGGLLCVPFIFLGAVFMKLAHDIRIRNGWPKRSPF